MKPVGALWLKEKNGKKFFSGSLELEGKEGPKLRVFVFRNEKKDSAKHPDYRVVLADDEEDERSSRRDEQTARERAEEDDSIPF